MLKAFKIKTQKDGYLEVHECPDGNTVALILDDVERVERTVYLDSKGWSELMDLNWKVDIKTYIQPEREEV